MIGAMLDGRPATKSSVARATESLEARGLIDQDALTTRQARYMVADPVMALWLERNAAVLLGPDTPRCGT